MSKEFYLKSHNPIEVDNKKIPKTSLLFPE